MTTQRPVRETVTVGQVRRYGEKDLTVYAVEGENVFYCRQGDEDEDGYQHDGGCCWFDLGWFSALPIVSSPSASPASGPDRSKCKAWCGKPYETPGLPCEFKNSLGERGAWPLVLGEIRVARSRESLKEPAWCSPACRNARVPPLESKPAETGKSEEDLLRSQLDAMKATPEQEAPKVPKCGNNGCDTPYQNVARRYCISLDENGNRDGVDLEWSCEPCHRMDEIEFAERTGAQSGTPYAGPERMRRPKLAHVGGNHDDDLVTW